MSLQPERPSHPRPIEDPTNVEKPLGDAERIASDVIGASIRIHRALGPGLLESVYEAVLVRELQRQGYRVERQRPIPIIFEGERFDEGFRCDLLIEGGLLVELKAVESIAPVHLKQVLSYIRLLGHSLGLLINFGAPTIKEGCRRVVDRHPRVTTARERSRRDLS